MGGFFDSKGFRTRLLVSIPMTAVLIPAYYLFDGLPFKLLLAFGLAMASMELTHMFFCNFCCKFSYAALWAFLFFTILAAETSIGHIEHSVLGTAVIASVSTDIGAYFFGNLIGGKLVKTRPFPKISPNKTWEGSIIGVFVGAAAVYFWTGGHFGYTWMVPVAFVGDILESLFKRLSGVKDSNDTIIQQKIPVLSKVESLLGGRNGHGGFYDRLDSLSLVLMVLFLVTP